MQKDIIKARKSGDTDDPVDVYVYDPIAIRLAHLFIKLHISANAVSCLSVGFGVLGAVLLYPQNKLINLAGMFCIVFAAVLDCCDGQVARLTHTGTQLGRIIDGVVDSVNFAAIYLSLGFRMMQEIIPFTNTRWGLYAFIPVVVTGLCHAGESRMADYVRGLHLYFLGKKSKEYFCRSQELEEEIAGLSPGKALEKLVLLVYLVYTRAQERVMPNMQRLLDKAAQCGDNEEERISCEYVAKSCQYIQLTNVLGFNTRAYTLFLMLLLNVHAFYFPFSLIIFESVKIFMTRRYEAIAGGLA